MPLSATGVIVALAIAAPQTAPVLVASASLQADQVIVAALPPPPESVTLQTRMFGTVDVPHRKHLELRVSCKSCHGPGTVGEIEFTPKAAHDLCRGCHQEKAAGPTGCRECHAVPDKPGSVEVAAAPAAPASTPSATIMASPTSTGTPQGSSDAAARAAPGAASTPGATAVPPSQGAIAERNAPPLARRDSRGDVPFTRSFEVGFVTLGESGHAPALGPTLTVKARRDHVVFFHSIAAAGGSRRGHTLALIGGGMTTRALGGWSGSAMAVGGFDADYRSAQMFPALGLRVDVDWTRDVRAFKAFSLSFVAVADVTRPRNQYGERVGGTIYGVTLTGAVPVPSGGRRR
jgi:predicted CXXCH cytochrome family protein